MWAGLIAFAVLAYVLLDGFDLGVGILFAVERRDEDRDVMLNSVAPVWDGNETWLVFGGGGLFAVFPLAYAVILPALYPAIIAMLLALVFRGVGFEFRFRAAGSAGACGGIGRAQAATLRQTRSARPRIADGRTGRSRTSVVRAAQGRRHRRRGRRDDRR